MSYYDESDYAIASIESEQKANGIKPQLCDGWRDVREDLPVKMGIVQIYTKSGYAIGYYSDEGKWDLFYGVDQPIAWMPLPKPPAFA